MPSRASASRLVRLRPFEWAALLEGLVTLTLASAAIRLVSFRRVAAWASRGPQPSRASDPEAVRLARWAVLIWARRAPWRVVCFQRGLTLHLMLRRRGVGSVMRYGVAHFAHKGLNAHVWVDVGGETVMGGDESSNFACVATFPPGAA